MNRREFLEAGATFGVGLAAVAHLARQKPDVFARRFAPNFGTFRHHAGGDPLDQIKFVADLGLAAVEDTGLRAKPVQLQTRIGAGLARRGVAMGLFVGLADFGQPSFTSGRKDHRDYVLRELRGAAETAKRVGGRFLAVVPGKRVVGLTHKEQMSHAVSMIQFCTDICDAHGLVMVLEPIDHGRGVSRLFLRSARQAALLCRAVGRPSCRFLLDTFQQTAVGEDLPELVRATSDVLGYVQLADYPGRKEPGTGVIAFREVLAALDQAGYRGLFGMEHGNALPGREGERAVIDAYTRLDRPRVESPVGCHC